MNKEPKEEVIKCDHTGYWKSAGISTLNSQSGVVFIATILFCENCGEHAIRLSSVSPQKPEEPVKPILKGI